MEQFEQLSHDILLYNSTYDDTYFVTRFLGGLSEEVRAGITLHQPKDVQEASSLALLQETELETRKKGSKDFSRPSFKSSSVSDRGRPTTLDKPPAPLPKQKMEKSKSEDKIKALMAF